MVEEDLSKIVKNLSPQDKIKKLKELQKKDQEEIEKAQKLIKESEREEEREEELKKIPIPQMRAENIDELFTPEEKEMFKAKRQVATKQAEEKPKKKTLEEEAGDAEVKRKEDARAEIMYSSSLAKRPEESLFNRVKEIYSSVKETGYISSSEQKELDEIHYANAKKLHDIESGNYDPTKEAAREMVLSEKMRTWIQDAYGRRRTNY